MAAPTTDDVRPETLPVSTGIGISPEIRRRVTFWGSILVLIAGLVTAWYFTSGATLVGNCYGGSAASVNADAKAIECTDPAARWKIMSVWDGNKPEEVSVATLCGPGAEEVSFGTKEKRTYCLDDIRR